MTANAAVQLQCDGDIVTPGGSIASPRDCPATKVPWTVSPLSSAPGKETGIPSPLSTI